MNKSTDVAWYKYVNPEGGDGNGKGYLLMFDVVDDISTDIKELDDLLYNRMCAHYYNTRKSSIPTGEGWEVL